MDHELNLKAQKFARASEMHELSRITTIPALRSSLKGHSEKEQVDILKQQLNIAVLGFGWVEYKTAWSCAKDPQWASLTDLQANVEPMIKKDGKMVPPAESPIPDSSTKKLQPLGSMSLRLSKLLLSKKAKAVELRNLAQKAHLQKEVAALAAKEARRGHYAEGQPASAPEITVDMHIEILTAVTVQGEDGALHEYN